VAVVFVRPKIPKLAPDPWAIQFDGEGRLKHLLTIEGIGPDWINRILDTAESFLSVTGREVKKVPLLRGRTVVTCSSNPPPAPAPPSSLRPSACPPTC